MSSYTRFHVGEVQVQAQYGTDTDEYEAFSIPMMEPDLNPMEVNFVSHLTYSYAGSVDAEGRPWASPLLSIAGPLFSVRSSRHITASPSVAAGDPLIPNIEATGQLSINYMELATRRRAKSIGTATIESDGSIDYHMSRNFGLCPKYIYKRSHQPAERPETAIEPTRSRSFSDADIEQFRVSDTVFFASFSPHGADVTHRGGAPGFVSVHDPTRLEIPDYFGNGMFNTLGNLVLDDRMAVSTTDFQTGRTVHTTGRATVEATGLPEPAPQRRLFFDVEEVIVTGTSVGHWTDIEPSRYTPIV